MPQTTTTTTTPAAASWPRHTTVISDLYQRGSAPGDRSGGLDRLVEAAAASRRAYDELDYLADHIEHDSDARTLIEAARNAAYETWQLIERRGLPLLQAWQRETLGYSEAEISR